MWLEVAHTTTPALHTMILSVKNQLQPKTDHINIPHSKYPLLPTCQVLPCASVHLYPLPNKCNTTILQTKFLWLKPHFDGNYGINGLKRSKSQSILISAENNRKSLFAYKFFFNLHLIYCSLYVWVCAGVHVCVYICVCVYIHTCMYLCVCTCVDVCLDVHRCMHLCKCILYILIHV